MTQDDVFLNQAKDLSRTAELAMEEANGYAKGIRDPKKKAEAMKRIQSAREEVAPKFYLTFSNDDIEFFLPVAFAWTEEGLNDFHVQFDGPGETNYLPKLDKGRFILRYDHGGSIVRDHKCKSMEITAVRPTSDRARELKPETLKTLWREL
jgi:hypothetical protein